MSTRHKSTNGYDPDYPPLALADEHAQAARMVNGERIAVFLQKLVEDVEMEARAERAAIRRDSKQQHGEMLPVLQDLTAGIQLLSEAVSQQTVELTRLRTELRLDNLRREETEWDERVRQAVPSPQVPLPTEVPRRGRKPWSAAQRAAASERMKRRHAAKRAAQTANEVPS